MSDNPVTLKDLRVHYRPSGGLPKQVKQRSATVDDLVEALKDLGATIEIVGEPGYRDHYDGAWIRSGSYLVYKIKEG